MNLISLPPSRPLRHGFRISARAWRPLSRTTANAQSVHASARGYGRGRVGTRCRWRVGSKGIARARKRRQIYNVSNSDICTMGRGRHVNSKTWFANWSMWEVVEYPNLQTTKSEKIITWSIRAPRLSVDISFEAHCVYQNPRSSPFSVPANEKVLSANPQALEQHQPEKNHRRRTARLLEPFQTRKKTGGHKQLSPVGTVDTHNRPLG